jgi:hypothetical protein
MYQQRYLSPTSHLASQHADDLAAHTAVVAYKAARAELRGCKALSAVQLGARSRGHRLRPGTGVTIAWGSCLLGGGGQCVWRQKDPDSLCVANSCPLGRMLLQHCPQHQLLLYHRPWSLPSTRAVPSPAPPVPTAPAVQEGNTAVPTAVPAGNTTTPCLPGATASTVSLLLCCSHLSSGEHTARHTPSYCSS